ncbi:glycosyltransferase family 61 protein [Rhodopila sp.]|uniref:glycosyltransferase family 61 protein n=1 Tax=Rhodopila sp. TaxID=2480087 RepID=UPI002D7F00D6|nr:glycosyltransferase family 61 protein [Rhodopila sp.]
MSGEPPPANLIPIPADTGARHDMTPVFETIEVEPALPWPRGGDIIVGAGIPPQIAQRYAAHHFSLPVQHVTARHVVLDADTGLVFHRNVPLPWSCFFGPHDHRMQADCAAARTRHQAGSLSVTGRRVFCGFNRHYRNYAHWVTQCIPAIAGYAAADPGFMDGILLLPPLPEAYEQALSLAGLTLPEVLRVDPSRTVSAETLVWSSLLGHHHAPSHLGRGVFGRMADAAGDDPAPHTRIYVSRSDSAARPLVNEADLAGRLQDLGIVTIVPGTLPIEQQIRHFKAARLIVGAHGAGLGNVVFCRPRSILYELMPDHWSGSFVGPSINVFAQTAGMHYVIDAYRALGTWARDGHQVPWAVDVDAVLDRVRAILAHQDC